MLQPSIMAVLSDAMKPVNARPTFSPGARVKLHSLVKEELNGAFATVRGTLPTGRMEVRQAYVSTCSTHDLRVVHATSWTVFDARRVAALTLLSVLLRGDHALDVE